MHAKCTKRIKDNLSTNKNFFQIRKNNFAVTSVVFILYPRNLKKVLFDHKVLILIKLSMRHLINVLLKKAKLFMTKKGGKNIAKKFLYYFFAFS